MLMYLLNCCFATPITPFIFHPWSLASRHPCQCHSFAIQGLLLPPFKKQYFNSNTSNHCSHRVSTNTFWAHPFPYFLFIFYFFLFFFSFFLIFLPSPMPSCHKYLLSTCLVTQGYQDIWVRANPIITLLNLLASHFEKKPFWKENLYLLPTH